MYLLSIYLAIVVASASGAKQKSIVISLDATWTQTSLFAEVGEFVAHESNAAYWSYVRSLVQRTSPASLAAKNDEQLHETAVKCTEGILDSSRLGLLKMALALRAHSPAVQMQQQLAVSHAKAELCAAFVDVNGVTSCEVSQIEQLIATADDRTPSDIYSGEHIFPGGEKGESSPLAILYGEVITDEWQTMHHVLKTLAEKGKIRYVHRHFAKLRSGDRVSGRIAESTPVRLSGYGVELAIKSQEYKAQDDSKIHTKGETGGDGTDEEEDKDLSGFNFKTLKELHPELKEGLNSLKESLYEVDELTPLKQWELQDLSYQAAQKVLNADPGQQLELLRDISQNFPLIARSLTRTAVKQDTRWEIEQNQDDFEKMGINAGDSALLINGVLTDVDSLDVYGLLDTLKKEQKLAKGFHDLGLKKDYLPLLTNLDLSDDSVAYAVDYRTAMPEYLNNLDKDKAYRDWGNSVEMLLQPYFPGMIRPIARNFFTLIFIIDPASSDGRSLLTIAESFFSHQVPIRLGVVWVTTGDRSVTGMDDASVALLNYFNFVRQDVESAAKALRALIKVYQTGGDRERNITVEEVHAAFKKRYSDEDLEMTFGADSDYDTGRQAGVDFVEKSGLRQVPNVLLNGVPLDQSALTADRFEETVINAIMKATPKFQRAIMEKKLKDNDAVGDWVMDQGDVMPRLNPFILDADKESRPQGRSPFVDFTDMKTHEPKSVTEFAKLSPRQMSAYMMQTMKYMKRTYDDYMRTLTLWIVADLETPSGRQLLYDAVKRLKHTHNIRIGLIHNTKHEASAAKPTSITRLVQAALWSLPAAQAKQFVTKLLKEENVVGLKDASIKLADLTVNEMSFDKFEKEMKLMDAEFIGMDLLYCRTVLNLKQGEQSVVANGQVLGALPHAFTQEDYALLEKYAMARYASRIADQVVMWKIGDEEDVGSDMVMRLSSLIMDDPIKKKRVAVDIQQTKHSVITQKPGDSNSPHFDIVAIVDPLSRDAQKMSHVLITLKAALNANLRLAMNPKAKLSEMPLKRFYRYVWEPQLTFTNDGQLRYGPLARFSHLPQKQLLTLNVQPAEAWMVQATRAVYDLDNIIMNNVVGDVVAEFELENILLEGHCYDDVTGNPPRGLQFLLTSAGNTFDTIVMANLGYFQLKANPGVWKLALREGRSQEIYNIKSVPTANALQTNEENVIQSATIVMDDFTGRVVRVRVAKKADMLKEELLSDSKTTTDDEQDEEEEDSGGIWKSLSESLTGGGGGSNSDGQTYETINIFSLASGHLYERFLRLMMLSVLKNTQHPVKFWLLKNYLSPNFKKFLPVMAEEYGFDYALVEYKWPRWLHGQKEKQRLMWGYKLLFLDVLFPLNVNKIIFVDADQIVRVDMMELMTLPLDGAPYGYTPFCDSRKDMEGYRFWKHGYWANHLGKRRYHISALYVVDLAKFRRIAAGDRLRGQYQALSADPNSLSNLDQDLPNNMIHQVRIKSLPQEWLWCETWCDNASKSSAKTIDLCNNPQTKEPKLNSAMRIIPEWKSYDDEIKSLLADFESGKRTHPDSQAHKHSEL